jgi:hypothetical protein
MSKDDPNFPKMIRFYDVLTNRCLPTASKLIPTVSRRYSYSLSNQSTISLTETGVNGIIPNKLGTHNYLESVTSETFTENQQPVISLKRSEVVFSDIFTDSMTSVSLSLNIIGFTFLSDYPYKI